MGAIKIACFRIINFPFLYVLANVKFKHEKLIKAFYFYIFTTVIWNYQLSNSKLYVDLFIFLIYLSKHLFLVQIKRKK